MIAQQIAEQLPAIVAEASKAFSNIGQFTVLNGAEGVAHAFAQVLGLGASAIPMLRGMLEQTQSTNGHAAQSQHAAATQE